MSSQRKCKYIKISLTFFLYTNSRTQGNQQESQLICHKYSFFYLHIVYCLLFFIIVISRMDDTAIVKAGSMIKRSQNKKRWSMVNYKTRWFELTRTCLMYFDNCDGGKEVRLIIYFLYCFVSSHLLLNISYIYRFFTFFFHLKIRKQIFF